MLVSVDSQTVQLHVQVMNSIADHDVRRTRDRALQRCCSTVMHLNAQATHETSRGKHSRKYSFRQGERTTCKQVLDDGIAVHS
jgi:hypothetical protein